MKIVLILFILIIIFTYILFLKHFVSHFLLVPQESNEITLFLFYRYFKGTFAKDCGEDDICVSDLNIMANLSLDLHESGSHYLLRLGEQNTVPLNVEVMNAGEPAYQSSLLVHHHKALELNLKESQVSF